MCSSLMFTEGNEMLGPVGLKQDFHQKQEIQI